MEDNRNESNGNRPKFNVYIVYAIVAILLVAYNFYQFSTASDSVNMTKIEEMVKAGDIKQIEIINGQQAEVYIKPDSLGKDVHKSVAKTAIGTPNTGPHYVIGNIGSIEVFEKKIAQVQTAENKILIEYKNRYNIIGTLVSWLLLILVLFFVWSFIMRRVGGGGVGGGSQIFNIGKSKATLFDGDSRVNITFKDVAGLDEAKEEVVEVVDFLKNPKKYTALGGKIPKGVLLVGSPGTGKTLLAKAVAGEAGVPFFSISGSDFVEMFVGVGASRVRDLFKQARDKAPCIIFIDEIDAIGRARGRNAMQGNDERENTLNQLLVEMDGFSTDKGVIIMAATNRPDILDSALMRPGRFDRQITIDKPDLVGREQIFKVHLKPLKIAPDVDPKKLSMQTPGFAGAEIANVCNEAALIAARKNKKQVDMEDFNQALDRIIGGLEKKNKLILPEEKRIIAYHEAGHTLCMWYLEHADSFVKVTIVPRGMAGGFAQFLPKENMITTEQQILDKMCVTLGGRAAEELVFNKISTGAGDDLMRVTQSAYGMITYYGMNNKVGNVSFYDPQGQYQFNRPYSEETASMIDNEARLIIENQYVRAKNLLKERRKELEIIANELINKEVLHRDDVERLIGKRPFDDVPGEDGEKAKSENNGVDTLRDDDIATLYS
jgi:cell division protease FtsH